MLVIVDALYCNSSQLNDEVLVICNIMQWVNIAENVIVYGFVG